MLIKDLDTALLQAADLAKVGTPTEREVQFLRTWLQRPTMGNNFLSDFESKIWGEQHKNDLVTLFPREPLPKRDAFTALLNGALLDIYNGILGQGRKVCSAHHLFE